MTTTKTLGTSYRVAVSTAQDMSPFYRLHRATCPRRGEGTIDAYEFAVDHPTVVPDVKTCSKCKPSGAALEEFEVTAARSLGQEATPEPEPEATPEPEQVQSSGGVYAGPGLTFHPVDGRVLGVTATRYPEATDDVPLWCVACEEVHPAHRFPYRGTKGSGRGRGVECRKARDDRAEARKANGTVVKPGRLDAAHVAPKAPKE